MSQDKCKVCGGHLIMEPPQSVQHVINGYPVTDGPAPGWYCVDCGIRYAYPPITPVVPCYLTILLRKFGRITDPERYESEFPHIFRRFGKVTR
jgi:hypothetical protein